jgi:hypothetical protein
MGAFTPKRYGGVAGEVLVAIGTINPSCKSCNLVGFAAENLLNAVSNKAVRVSLATRLDFFLKC